LPFPLDPKRFISQLCARFGVPADFGRRLQPLAERAAAAQPEKRRLLLEMIERSFAEEARRRALTRALARACGEPDDWRVLSTVASALHGWEPPTWFEGWGENSPAPREEP